MNNIYILLISMLLGLLACNESKKEVIKVTRHSEMSVSTSKSSRTKTVSKTTYISKVDYIEYCNDRFDFCILYPNDFIPQGQSQNGDGQEFLSRDGKISILFYGSLVDDEFNTMDMNFKHLVKNENIQVSYQLKKDSYYVVSGIKHINGEEYIYYHKTIEKENILLNWMITYPVSEQHIYDSYCILINEQLK